ncbi:MAG: Minf_1886 family protein [Planctomycetota bacterium]
MSPEIAVWWDKIRELSLGFPPGAYTIVQDGLRHTAEQMAEHREEGTLQSRHVTGQELCLGIRDFAIDQFGLLARTVLEGNGIRRTEDIGRIVFALVDVGLMRKTDEDCLEDFQGVFDFDDAFGTPLRVNS